MQKPASKHWFRNFRADFIASLVVLTALVPEVIGFTLVAGVNPLVGIYSSLIISVTMAFFGARPGVVSAAAGATALVLAGLVSSHGIEYMLLATILSGIIQIFFSLIRFGSLLRFIPKSVMTGFVNALGILMFTSQLDYILANTWTMVLAGIGIIIIIFGRKVKGIRRIPLPLLILGSLALIALGSGADVPVLGDLGDISASLPQFFFPSIPLNFETLQIIFPYALSVALVGTVESLLTAQIVDDYTKTTSNKNKEAFGLGLANIFAGFFGGIAGCGMIGQSILNITNGGISRLATLLPGVLFFIFALLFGNLLMQIPIVAFATVMLLVSYSTFSWQSLTRIRHVPLLDTIVMLATVIVVLATHNLAFGVITGIIISTFGYMIKSSAHLHVDSQTSDGKTTYFIRGSLFFGATTTLMEQINFELPTSTADLDLSSTKIFDETGVEAIDKIILKFQERGIEAKIINANPQCQKMLDDLATYHLDGPPAIH